MVNQEITKTTMFTQLRGIEPFRNGLGPGWALLNAWLRLQIIDLGEL